MRKFVKLYTAKLIQRTSHAGRYENCIFVLGHMRCGSTAITNLLCSHDDVSGYGEHHITYENDISLGRLVLNQKMRSAFDPKSSMLCDKILHNRYDQFAPGGFFLSHGVFIIRRPQDAMRSIKALFQVRNDREFESDERIAIYYVERLRQLKLHWQRFAPDRRFGSSYEKFCESPDHEIERLSKKIGFLPELRNEYVAHPASQVGGGGDPTFSGSQSSFVKMANAQRSGNNIGLCVSETLMDVAENLYGELNMNFAADN